MIICDIINRKINELTKEIDYNMNTWEEIKKYGFVVWDVDFAQKVLQISPDQFYTLKRIFKIIKKCTI